MDGNDQCLNLPEKGKEMDGRHKVFCWLMPSPESQECHAASAREKRSRGQGQRRDGRRKCSDTQETVQAGLSYDWILHQPGQEATHDICVSQGQGSFSGRPEAPPFQPWGSVLSLLSFSRKPHATLWPV